VPLALDQSVLPRDGLVFEDQLVVPVSADIDAVGLDRDGPGMAVFPRDSKHLHRGPCSPFGQGRERTGQAIAGSSAELEV